MSSNDWSIGWDLLTDAIGAANGKSAGSIDDVDHLSIDQRIAVAQVVALLAIAQEVNHANPDNLRG